MDRSVTQRVGRPIVPSWRTAWIAVRRIVLAARPLSASCGTRRRASFDPLVSFPSMNSGHSGSSVCDGLWARIVANEGFFAGDHVAVGPGPLDVGGDEDVATAGRYMLDVKTGAASLRVRDEDAVDLGARGTQPKGLLIDGAAWSALAAWSVGTPPRTPSRLSRGAVQVGRAWSARIWIVSQSPAFELHPRRCRHGLKACPSCA